MFSFDEISFNPDFTFSSGQTFRWRRMLQEKESFWIGVVADRVVKVSGKTIECFPFILKDPEAEVSSDFQTAMKRYFSFDDDLNFILKSFPQDEYFGKALEQFAGLRILSQDPWECLISFICSINKNIPAITSEIELLSRKFGKKIAILDKPVYTFPTSAMLSKASKTDLLACQVGFRWKYIKFVAKRVSSGSLDLDSLRQKTYDQARNELVSELSSNTFGVGPKVADCLCLFSLHKMEAFPIDVWILRCLKEHYSRKLGISKLLNHSATLTRQKYNLIHDEVRSYFGRYCGYAQQYLYMKIRADSIRSRELA